MISFIVAVSAVAVVVTPIDQTEQSVSIGSVIYELSRFPVVDRIVMNDDLSVKLPLATLSLSSGDALVQEASKAKVKACDRRDGGSGLCLLDDDGDGLFDRWTQADTFFAAKTLKVAAAYKVASVPLAGARGSFRSTLTFLGAADGSLRLSYREFSDDLARPAFTEDYVVPLGRTYPQIIAIKDVRFSVKAIEGSVIRYAVEK